MATSRTQQAHQKRVQKIVEEAADQIAATSPIEEQVVVTVEELPPDDEAATRGEDELTDAMRVSAQAGQELTANWIDTWTDLTQQAWSSVPTLQEVSPRAIVEESFRVAHELLMVQKDFALRLVDAMPTRR